MCSTVYISWQDPASRLWYVVGRLSEQMEGGFEFVYTKGAQKSKNFIPFPGMSVLERVYRSSELFPLFANRLLGKNRPEYRQFIDWLELPVENPSPLDILSRSGGARATDSFQVFERVRPNDQGEFSVIFFLHGLSHVGKSAPDRVLTLKPGEPLRLAPDPQNQVDNTSIMLIAEPTEVIGFLPRYLARDMATLLEQDATSLQARVIATHDRAPRHYKLLCEVNGKVPEELKGKVFENEEYSPIANFC